MERGNLDFHAKGKAQVENPQGEIPMGSTGAEESVVVMKGL
jgi:hypothetical protein